MRNGARGCPIHIKPTSRRPMRRPRRNRHMRRITLCPCSCARRSRHRERSRAPPPSPAPREGPPRARQAHRREAGERPEHAGHARDGRRRHRRLVHRRRPDDHARRRLDRLGQGHRPDRDRVRDGRAHHAGADGLHRRRPRRAGRRAGRRRPGRRPERRRSPSLPRPVGLHRRGSGSGCCRARGRSPHRLRRRRVREGHARQAGADADLVTRPERHIRRRPPIRAAAGAATMAVNTHAR